MKKNYMKPEGKVVAMSVRENIASSGGSLQDTYKVHYSIDIATGVKYIQGSSVVASNTNNKSFDIFYDMVKTYMHNLSNCRAG